MTHIVKVKSNFDDYQDVVDTFENFLDAVHKLAYLIWQNEYDYIEYWIESTGEQLIPTDHIFIDGPAINSIYNWLLKEKVTTSKEYYAKRWKKEDI